MFDVFVEGPVDSSPGAVRKLAETLAAKYGVSADDFAARLSRGRVRVKARVDRQTAEAYVRSLAKVGARCAIEATIGGEASAPITKPATPPAGVPVRATTPPAGMPVRAATPPAGLVRRATPPVGIPVRMETPSTGVPMPAPPSTTRTPGRGIVTARPAAKSGRVPTLSESQPALRPPAPYVAARFKTPSGSPSTEPRTSQPIATGLAAASDAVDTQLGALDNAGGALTLSSLDGEPAMDAAPESSGSFGPAVELDNGPYAPAPASPAPASPTPAGKPKDEPLDLFAPTDDGADFKVDVAPDEYAPKKSMPIPKEPDPLMPHAPALEAKSVARGKLGPLANVKVRFAAGVVAAILLGFLPATVVASIRERSAYRAIDDQYLSEPWDANLEAKFLDRKRSERRTIALTSMLIWAVAGGAVAYVWFRRVPWDRLG